MKGYVSPHLFMYLFILLIAKLFFFYFGTLMHVVRKYLLSEIPNNKTSIITIYLNFKPVKQFHNDKTTIHK